VKIFRVDVSDEETVRLLAPKIFTLIRVTPPMRRAE